MSARLLVPVVLLVAIATFPARSRAAIVQYDDGCDCCCCHDSTHTHLVIPRYEIDPFFYHEQVPYQANFTNGGTAGIAGAGLRLRGPILPRWDWSIEGGAGIGDIKTTITAVTSTTYESQFREVVARIAADYRRHGLYCGPGLKYESTRVTEKTTGLKDVKVNPFKLYGFEAHFGGTLPINRQLRLYGEDSEFIGRGTFSDTFGTQKLKVEGIYSLNSWQGGLRFRF